MIKRHYYLVFIVSILLSDSASGMQALFGEVFLSSRVRLSPVRRVQYQRAVNHEMKWQGKMLYSVSQSHKSTRINVKGLDLSFNHKDIFRDLDFSLLPGDKVTVVGENGVGKSTFLKVLLGDINNYDGTVEVTGKVGYLPQSFEGFDERPAIEHFIVNSCNTSLIELLHTSQKRYTENWYEEFNRRGGFSFLRSFAQLGVPKEHLEKSIFKLSGGEKTKLHLCTLEYSNPDILFLDEPTNHLDSRGIRWLSRFLRSFNGGLVMVTHDRALINNTTNRISELSPVTHKFTHFRGGYKNYLLEQEAIYERAKMERLRQEKELKSVKERLDKFQSSLQSTTVRRPSKDKDKLGFNARGERKQKGQAQLVNQLKQKAEILKEHLVQVPGLRKKVDFALGKDDKLENIYLELEGLSKITLFNSLSLRLENHDRLVITGKNGSGKTTLLKIVNGLILPDQGSIRLSNNAKLGFLDQEQDTLNLNETPFEILSKHSSLLTPGDNIVSFLEKFGIYHAHDLYNPLNTASIGCRRKVQLAEIVLRGCNILLLDEPTNHIDLFSLEKIEEQLLQFPGIVIAVSHDQYFLERIATKTLDIENY